MQVEIDWGNGFVDIGTQQLLSVPYALHSNSSSGVNFRISDSGDSLIFENGRILMIRGISVLNPYNGGEGAPHTCSTPMVHNPNLNYGSIMDQEGNVYKTILIGTQEWMSENLNTSIYRNGDEIQTDLDNETWSNTTSGAWTHYHDDASLSCPYGKLYNWYACTDTRQVCPVGWHVPSDNEWSTLINHLGGEALAGGKMKTTGTIETETGLWYTPNVEVTNSVGFSGLPGGFRSSDGGYYTQGTIGAFWNSTDFDEFVAWSQSLNNSSASSGKPPLSKKYGISVRCLRD